MEIRSCVGLMATPRSVACLLLCGWYADGFKKKWISIFLLFTRKSRPPHIHVVGRGGEAKLWLNPIEIAGVYRLNFKDQREILSITQENVKLFLDKWSQWHGLVGAKN